MSNNLSEDCWLAVNWKTIQCTTNFFTSILRWFSLTGMRVWIQIPFITGLWARGMSIYMGKLLLRFSNGLRCKWVIYWLCPKLCFYIWPSKGTNEREGSSQQSSNTICIHHFSRNHQMSATPSHPCGCNLEGFTLLFSLMVMPPFFSTSSVAAPLFSTLSQYPFFFYHHCLPSASRGHTHQL